jgi:Leucine-rich repeat (LRR) protein
LSEKPTPVVRGQRTLVFGNGNFFILHNLNLHKVGLEKIKVGAFEGLSQLKSLNLNFNNLKQLDKGVFDPLDNLLALDISDNQLVDLQPDLFSNLKNLESFFLDNNNQLNEKSLSVRRTLKP